MIKAIFINEIIKQYYGPYLRASYLVLLIMTSILFFYFLLLSNDSFQRISEYSSYGGNPFLFYESQWNAYTQIGLIPIYGFVFWSIFGIEDRYKTWKNLFQLPISLNKVVVSKLVLVLIVNATFFLLTYLLYQVFLIALIHFRSDLGFQNYTYEHVNLVKTLVKVYLTSSGTLIVIMPLMAIFRSLVLVIFISVILTMIPSEYNPLTLYSNNHDNWVYGLLLTALLFPIALYFYLPIKMKNVF